VAITGNDVLASLVEARGGPDALGIIGMELCIAITRLLVELRKAPAADVGRLSSTIASLLAQLPEPSDAPPPTALDLTKLSDDELAIVHAARSIIDGQDPGKAAVMAARQRNDQEVFGREPTRLHNQLVATRECYDEVLATLRERGALIDDLRADLAKLKSENATRMELNTVLSELCGLKGLPLPAPPDPPTNVVDFPKGAA